MSRVAEGHFRRKREAPSPHRAAGWPLAILGRHVRGVGTDRSRPFAAITLQIASAPDAVAGSRTLEPAEDGLQSTRVSTPGERDLSAGAVWLRRRPRTGRAYLALGPVAGAPAVLCSGVALVAASAVCSVTVGSR